jgi:hypothetical protein
MHITDKVYVPRNVYSVVNNWGTYVSTITATDASATVKILTNVQNDGATAAAVTLTTKVVDAANTVVWTEDKTQTIAAATSSVFDQTATVLSPKLWYPANSIYGRPNMYKVYHIVKVGVAVVDVFTSPLGIRVIAWDKDFPIINGHPHYLWGAASRYDYPALGTAVPEEQQWRDAKILTECGGNLWRPGHSTSAPEFVAACDAYGVMLVQPSGELEGNFATAQITDYKKTLKSEVHRDMIVRDRNNPSVLSWEVSNGPIDAAFEQSLHVLDSIWDPVHSRAMSDRGYGEAVKNGIADIYACSFVGCEVGLHTGTPQKPAWGAEGWSYTNRSSRFAYDYELSFASQYVQNWKKSRAANCFGMVQWYFCETPGEFGAFMETAQTPRSFGTSMLDCNRIPKMLYNIYKACWIPYSLKPNVSIAHHWNRSGNVRVNAFSNCPKVRLLINNVSQGEKTPNPWNTANNEENIQNTTALSNQCWWDVTWAAGTLKAEGLDANGTVVCSDQKVTAGAPHHIVLTVEPPLVKPDGNAFKITANATDAAFILAKVVDASGNWCPTAGNTITFSVTGPANYRGGSDQFVGSGGTVGWHGPGDPELLSEGGMCKIAVRSTFATGSVTVNAISPGLGSGTASFTVSPVSGPTSIDNPTFSQRLTPPQTIQVHVAGNIVRYFVSTVSAVSVEILDARGKVLNRIAEQGQGWHSIRLTATTTRGYNSGNGIFFVRCAVDGAHAYQSAQRFLVIR